MKIFKPSLQEIPYLVEIAKELHGLGIFGQIGPEFDWDFATHRFIYAWQHENFYVRCAMDDAGAYVGAVVGHVEHYFFSPQLMAIEDGWYVREGTKDRAKIAKALMMGFVDWALDEQHALIVQTGDIADISSFAVDTIYRHMGFTRFGTIYKFQRDT